MPQDCSLADFRSLGAYVLLPHLSRRQRFHSLVFRRDDELGYSAGDAILLTQLAWRALQGTIKACGEHDELTREVSSLHKVLKRLTTELENAESLLNRPGDDRGQGLREIGGGCARILNVMDSILTKYNALSEDKRCGKKLWQKIRFGNGELQDLSEIRLKLSTHTSAILMMVNLCSLGSQGRVETQLNNVGGELHGIRGKVDWIAANMAARSGDGTVWTRIRAMTRVCGGNFAVS
jgi:hypothetical protein